MLWLESYRFRLDRVASGPQLRKAEAARLVVLTLRFKPLSVLTMVTTAPEMAALVESVTCPVIALVVSPAPPGEETRGSRGEPGEEAPGVGSDGGMP